jgi:DNA repair exonuclease SbcCD ATPase subunit
VNQLYWRRRPVFNRLVSAADARRSAHAKLLKGKGGDVSVAEKAHSVALHAAAREIRALLTEAGHEPSSAMMNSVTDTLQALPGSSPAGRLTEPLRLVGFEALAGLVSNSERAIRGLTPAAPSEPPTRHASKEESPAAEARREAKEQKREQATRRREIAATTKALRSARQEARNAETLLAQAQRGLARVKQERDRLQDQLQFAVKQIDDAASDVREREQQLARAGQEQSRLEAKLAALNSAKP